MNRMQRFQLGESQAALERVKQANDAIMEIIEVLRWLPDPEMRRGVIEYLHAQLCGDDET